MAASSAILTRLAIIDEIYNYQLLNGMKVGISYNKEFIEASTRTLEQLFGVNRKDLTGEQAIIFDKEVKELSTNLPRFWASKKVKRTKKFLIRNHEVWVYHQITLQTPSIAVVAENQNATNTANLAENVDFNVVNNFFKFNLIMNQILNGL